jgi:crotonobetainyl-CoA:carnitine CoA-transferase CaiB-like acyl-CoA transferase
MGGLMSVTGERDDQPGGGPQKVGVPIVDILTGMYTAVAVLAALARRQQTGDGDHIDIAMLDVMAGTLVNQAMNYLMTGQPPRRTGNKHPNIQPQDVFATADGHLALAVGNDAQFLKFCSAIGRPDLGTDERFATNAARVRHLPVLTAMLRDLLASRSSGEWASLFDEAGIPCGPINSIPQVFCDPQVEHRGMVVDIPHPTAGKVPMVASPMRFANAPLEFRRSPPLLGQHTDEVLRELGLNSIEQLEGAATSRTVSS